MFADARPGSVGKSVNLPPAANQLRTVRKEPVAVRTGVGGEECGGLGAVEVKGGKRRDAQTFIPPGEAPTADAKACRPPRGGSERTHGLLRRDFR